jgi:ArsR family transcriptional regulator
MAKDDKYNKIAKICRALASPTRLRILDILISRCTCSERSERSESGCCVTDINDQIDLPQPYISKHLKILKDSGILTYNRDGNKIYYSFQHNDFFEEVIKYLSKCCK